MVNVDIEIENENENENESAPSHQWRNKQRRFETRRNEA